MKFFGKEVTIIWLEVVFQAISTVQIQMIGEKMTNLTAKLKFNEGEPVMYRRYGICRVVAAQTQSFGDEQKLYYCLEPIFGRKTKFFVPADMDELDNVLRKVYEKKQLDAAVAEASARECEWQEEGRTRTEQFDTLLKTGNLVDMLWLVKLLLLHKKHQREIGHTFLDMDKRVLAFAERLVADEFSYVCGIERDAAPEHVHQLLGVSLQKK